MPSASRRLDPACRPGGTADHLSPSRRRELMQAVRRSGTEPELALRRALAALGYRYRIGRRIDGTKPDIVFGPSRVAVFVDGCFWHGCPRHFVTPKHNAEFWESKITRN